MREIKFRAWDTSRNEMYCLSNQNGIKDIAFNEHGEINNIELFEYLPSTEFVFTNRNKNDVKLLQYTGLKDENNIEIYEGDIVSIVDCEPSLYKIIWLNDNFKYGVEYIGKDKTNWKEENLEEFSSDLIEVIGNIYENPELLNKGE